MDLTESYCIGQVDGIGMGETLFALAASMALEEARSKTMSGIEVLNLTRELFRKLCAEKKADLTPQTEKK